MRRHDRSRRDFLSRAGTLAVAFTLGPALTNALVSEASASIAAQPPAPTPTPTPNADLKVDAWLLIGPDNTVTIYSGKVELGTGIETAMTQIVAEELSVGFEQVHYVQGDTAQTPDQGFTAGSKSIQNQGPLLRVAAATAFQALLDLAAVRFGVPRQVLQAEDGRISVGGNRNRSATYAQLIGTQQIRLTSNASVPVVDPKRHEVVGTSVRRVDIPDKVTADFTYMADLRVPNMLHGRVVRPAGRNATFVSLNATAAQAVPGFVQVVQQGNFVGVIAQTEFAAIQAARALQVTWQQGTPLPAQATLQQHLTAPANVYQTNDEVNTGDVTAALANAPKKLQATYFTPYQMHAAMCPSCSIADVRSAPDASGIQATIWSGTQGPYPLRAAIAQLLGLDPAAVRVIYVEAAGCYGHNGADDVSGDAALLSKAVGKPVRVQWSRQDEHGWEPLGPAMVHEMKGGLDASGGLTAWHHTVYSPTHNTRPGGAGALLAGQAIGVLPAALPNVPRNAGTRNAPVTYKFPNDRLTANHVKIFETAGATRNPAAPLKWTLPRSTALRSLGGFSNTFANESFLDELATAAGADPVAFRLRYLDDPRAIAVVNAMADTVDWRRPLRPGPTGVKRGRGVSFLRYETVEAYVASCVEAEVTLATGAVKVTRVVVAHDCGQIINPDGLKNQIEGNVMQGISRTLHEEVTFNENGVTSVIWAPNPFAPTQGAYPVLNFADVPAVEIVLIDRPSEVPWGAGEPVIGAIGSAVGNAIFNATGVRLRTLPFTPARVKAALP